MAELSNEATEDYLAQIYRLSLVSTPVKTSVLARALRLSPAAVTEIVKRLSERRLVRYEP